MKIHDNFLEVIKKEEFMIVYPNEYAKSLKEKFLRDTSLWYKHIIPLSKAKELLESTNGDYSLIWEERCASCFKEINKSTKELCYVSKDGLTWFCSDCYNKVIAINSV